MRKITYVYSPQLNLVHSIQRGTHKQNDQYEFHKNMKQLGHNNLLVLEMK